MVEYLQNLLQSIQPFAAWHVDHLVTVYREYINRLNQTGDLEYSTELKFLRENSTVIHQHIEEVLRSRGVMAYNRAASELAMDIESLIRIVDVKD